MEIKGERSRASRRNSIPVYTRKKMCLEAVSAAENIRALMQKLKIENLKVFGVGTLLLKTDYDIFPWETVPEELKGNVLCWETVPEGVDGYGWPGVDMAGNLLLANKVRADNVCNVRYKEGTSEISLGAIYPSVSAVRMLVENLDKLFVKI